MHHLLLDKTSLSQVFLSFEPIEALRVKENMLAVFEELSLPSNELLAEMAKQGISLPTSSASKPKLDIQSISSSVLQSHLVKLFLDQRKLLQTIKAFTLTQQVEVKNCLLELMPMLHLPSPCLIDKMKRSGVLDALMEQDNIVDKVRDKISALSEPSSRQDLEQVKSKLAKLEHRASSDELNIARVKAKLNKLSEQQFDDGSLNCDKVATLG